MEKKLIGLAVYADDPEDPKPRYSLTNVIGIVTSLEAAQKLIDVFEANSNYEPNIGIKFEVAPVYTMSDSEVETIMKNFAYPKKMYVNAMIFKDCVSKKFYAEVSRSTSLKRSMFGSEFEFPSVENYHLDKDKDTHDCFAEVSFVVDISDIPKTHFGILEYIENKVNELTNNEFNVTRVVDDMRMFGG